MTPTDLVMDDCKTKMLEDLMSNLFRRTIFYHEYYRINIININDVKSMFANIDTTGQGAIWWNGAMKRSSANIMKTSEQSHAYAIKFITYLHELDPDMICYGSDHCALQFDGLPASECSARVSAADSRAQLWRTIME
jgi:hypothetical protein